MNVCRLIAGLTMLLLSQAAFAGEQVVVHCDSGRAFAGEVVGHSDTAIHIRSTRGSTRLQVGAPWARIRSISVPATGELLTATPSRRQLQNWVRTNRPATSAVPFPSTNVPYAEKAIELLDFAAPSGR